MALEPMYYSVKNSPEGILKTGVNSSATTIVLEEDGLSGAFLDMDLPNLLVISDIDSSGILSSEVVKATSVIYDSGSINITVVRGYHGYLSNFVAGAKVARSYTTYDHDTFKDNIEELYDTKLALANNLTETVTGKALDATQGKILNDNLVEHKAEIATDAHNAKNISILNTNNYFVANNVEDALEELLMHINPPANFIYYNGFENIQLSQFLIKMYGTTDPAGSISKNSDHLYLDVYGVANQNTYRGYSTDLRSLQGISKIVVKGEVISITSGASVRISVGTSMDNLEDISVSYNTNGIFELDLDVSSLNSEYYIRVGALTGGSSSYRIISKITEIYMVGEL